MAPLRITAILLAGLWALGIDLSASGGLVHLLAVVAIALLFVERVKNRRVNL